MQYLRRLAPSAAIAVFSALAATTAGAAPERGYSVTDIGVFQPNTGVGINAVDLNNVGQIGGSSDGRAFVWSMDGGFRYVDALGSVGVSAINDRGQLVGSSASNVGFLTSGGSSQSVQWLDFLPTGLNNVGTVLGFNSFYRDGVRTALGTGLSLRAINDQGRMTGGAALDDFSGTAVIVDPSGRRQTIITADGFSLGDGQRINRQGHIVGSPGETGPLLAYFYSSSRGVQLLGGNLGTFSEVGGLNDHDLVVGRATGNDFRGTGFVSFAGGSAVDLNTLLDRVSGDDWTITRGADINNAGQILAEAIGRDGLVHKVLLTPGSGGVCIPGKGLLAALGVR